MQRDPIEFIKLSNFVYFACILSSQYYCFWAPNVTLIARNSNNDNNNNSNNNNNNNNNNNDNNNNNNNNTDNNYNK